MALKKFTRVTGSVETDSIILNVDFELVDNKPSIISFNFNKDNVFMSGSYSSSIDYYSVSGGTIPDGVINEVEEALASIKSNYEDFLA